MKSLRSPAWLILPIAAGMLAVLAWLGFALPRTVRAGSEARLALTVFINEIHYDNAGTDSGEGVEIAGPAGTDLTGWSLVLYDGVGGAVYNTRALSGSLPDLQNGFGVLFFAYSTNGLRNGPVGIALVDSSNAVVQFLSYAGRLHRPQRSGCRDGQQRYRRG